MNSMFYPKLAITNIKKNAKFNFPYILTSMGIIAMYYVMNAVTNNSQMIHMPSYQNLEVIMNLGCWVITIFAVIFLFYTNSFLMKRRKKEIGLYNILGMEKKHISKILTFESAIMFLISSVGGLLCGILFNKLIIMFFVKLVNFDIVLKFEVNKKSLIISLVLFALIFLLTLIYNLAKIHLSKPIELLNGSKTGEKEPKTKILMTIVGIVCLAAAYYIANTVESPLSAFSMFFVAVVLVIIGTYFIFVAGSIAVLKILRKNKKYYYKTEHFTSVSGMIYRMKQNAVGLANICILSTMVLVMISASVSMYIGVNDALDYRYPNDIRISREVKENDILTENKQDTQETLEKIKKVAEKQNRKISNIKSYCEIYFPAIKESDRYITKSDTNLYGGDTNIFEVITADSYNSLTGENISLNDDEILVYNKRKGDRLPDSVEILGQNYKVKQRLDEFPIAGDFTDNMPVHKIVVSNAQVLKNMFMKKNEIFKDKPDIMHSYISFDLDGTDSEIIKCYKKITSSIKQKIVEPNGTVTYGLNAECKQESRDSFYGMYGCILFLGIFLGVLFIMATVLIIYYKQISEGYDDKERFEIMQKVGMSKEEIKGTIKSQVLSVFFLPIIVAGIHVFAAFKMVTKLLALLNLINVPLFVICFIITIIVFAIMYGIVYALTAKVYYNIVEK